MGFYLNKNFIYKLTKMSSESGSDIEEVSNMKHQNIEYCSDSDSSDVDEMPSSKHRNIEVCSTDDDSSDYDSESDDEQQYDDEEDCEGSEEYEDEYDSDYEAVNTINSYFKGNGTLEDILKLRSKVGTKKMKLLEQKAENWRNGVKKDKVESGDKKLLKRKNKSMGNESEAKKKKLNCEEKDKKLLKRKNKSVGDESE